MTTLGVVEKASKFTEDMSQGVVVVESSEPDFSKAFDDLQSQGARNLAIRYASQQGMGAVHLNGSAVGPYPVNKAGQVPEQIVDERGDALPPDAPERQPARYRIDFPLIRPLH